MADTKDANTVEVKKKTGVLKYLDNTFTDSGLKTDVKITLTDGTALKIVGAAVAATILSSLSYFIIRGMFNRVQIKQA